MKTEKNESFAEKRRKAEKAPYDPEPVVERLTQLLQKHNLSYRQASLKASLHHQSVRRIIVSGKRPNMIECILLANYFDINPNELLQEAQWPTLKAFELQDRYTQDLPPEAIEVAVDLSKLEDDATRKQVSDAIRMLLAKFFDD